MKDWRREIDENIEEALFSKGELSYDELKETIEGEQYLDLKQAGKELTRDVYIRHLKRLADYRRITSRPCKPVTSKRRRCYSLTSKTHKEKDLKFSKTFNIYILIIFGELQDKPVVQYELTPQIFEDFMRIGVDLSSEKLEKIKEIFSSSTTRIYYKPISCVQVIEEQHEFLDLNNNANMAIKKQFPAPKTERNLICFEPMTESDLRTFESLLSNYRTKKTERFFRIYGFSKSDIIKKAKKYYSDISEHDLRLKIVDKVFLDMEKDGIIYIFDYLNKQPRYLLSYDLSSLLYDCLAIKDEIEHIMKEWWKGIYPPDDKAKVWLAFNKPTKDVERETKFYLAEYKKNSMHRIRRARELKEQTKQATDRLKDRIHQLKEIKYNKTINKYNEYPFVNDFITVCTNPPILQDFINKFNTLK